MLRRHALGPALAALSLAAGLCAAPGASRAAEAFSTSTTCNAGQSSPDWDTIWNCDGTSHYAHGALFTGASSATCNSANKGLTRYNTTSNALEFCNGSAWTPLYQVQSTPAITAPAGSGYFVLTNTTWTGNLGGLSGADSKCLTELSATSTGWQGYSTANSNGQLVAAKVHGFLCDNTTCNNLMPLTTYYFATAGNAGAGGASFTTDSSGVGPGDSNPWSAANYFSSSAIYRTGRTITSATAWANTTTSNNGNNCFAWSFATTGSSSINGNSTATDGGRWNVGVPSCDTLRPIICYVNP